MSLETFASPGLRWGLLLEDHPGAKHEFEMRSGKQLGIPEQFGGGGNFCVCTIIFPAGSGLEDVVAWKPVPAKGNADDWVVICTKTLGRALKKAGYPDDMKDLKALVHWRERNAEVAAISSGNAIAALGAGDQDHSALDEAATTDEIGVDDAPETRVGSTVDDDIVDGEIVEDEPSGSNDQPQLPETTEFDQRLAVVRRELNEVLTEGEQTEFREWLAAEEIPPRSNQWGESELSMIEEWLFAGSDQP